MGLLLLYSCSLLSFGLIWIWTQTQNLVLDWVEQKELYSLLQMGVLCFSSNAKVMLIFDEKYRFLWNERESIGDTWENLWTEQFFLMHSFDQQFPIHSILNIFCSILLPVNYLHSKTVLHRVDIVKMRKHSDFTRNISAISAKFPLTHAQQNQNRGPFNQIKPIICVFIHSNSPIITFVMETNQRDGSHNRSVHRH